MTKSISADAASISVVLPFVRILSKTFGEYHDDHGVRTMKREMNASLERRFSDAEGNENLLIATILDPRFKEKFFTGATIVEKVKSLVCEKIGRITRQREEDNPDDNEIEPSSKRPCSGIWKNFSDILEEAGASVSNERSWISTWQSL